MEQAEKGMNEKPQEQDAVRKYLLGNLGDEAKMHQIEENLLLDGDFEEHLSIAEDELVEAYLDETLTATERERFLHFFLITPERIEKLRFIRNLRKYAGKSDAAQTVKQFSKQKSGWFDWRGLFSSPAWRFAAIALLVLVAGFSIWRIAFYQSDVDKGLAELRLAYRGQRPIEARTTANFDYAPYSITRGGNSAVADDNARRLADTYLLGAAKDAVNAEAHHALGLLYLAEKNFDKALQEFNFSLKLSPDNAKLYSDLGALYLEMNKKAVLDQDRAHTLEYLDQSLKHLEKAITLDPKLPEPRFNRALCLQALYSPEQAKQAWREYLELDSNSKWAEEARRNLESLESQKTQDLTATELEQDFLAAFIQKRDEEAWRLLSRNRELIREKYLPQRLAMSFLAASDNEKGFFLQAFQYTGELELNHIADPFASELAQFYKSLPENKIEPLKQAQNAIRNGYELCLKLKYREALNQFYIARELFSRADDVWEMKLSEYFISYCLINTERVDEGIVQLNQIVEFSRSRKYKWLEVTSLYWLAAGFRILKQGTESKRTYEKALALAEEIKDSYTIQRNLLELAKYNSFVSQKQSALNYLQRVLKEADAPETSLRQKYRNYSESLQILAAAKLYNAAKPIAFEAVSLADKLKDHMFETFSRSNAAIADVQTGNLAEARMWLNDGKEKTEMIADESSRKRMIAYSFLASGYIERQAENYEKAEQFYDEAVKIYETMEAPSNLYVAQKGKLLSYLALGKNAELEQQIPTTLKLTEDYREKILEEQERTSFFDTEESIYDIAVDHEFGNGEYERAYNYTEASNARSLLDWLQKGVKIAGDSKKTKILLEENAKPMTLSEIRARMPDGVQILQYSVLDSKVLIWLVSKEKFVVIPTKIQSDGLREKVEHYVKLLTQKNNTAQADSNALAGELYDLLISPIVNQLNPAQQICLIPNKVLFYLPFATLISPTGKPFLADFSFSYAPSANIFLLCTENARMKEASTDETLLSIGNPAFDSHNFDNLPDLPSAEKEARAIAALYERPKTFFGKEATKTALQSSIKDADIIHFAGHYVVVNDAPLSSYLLLAQNGKKMEDGVLTNSDLVNEKLSRVKLVVLSACQTGVEQYYNGEGLIGLSRTFLAAGAPLVVASQWSVETEASAELMKRFHLYRRQEKMSTTAALRRAQLEMLNEPNGRFREPYYWAAFATFGGYATF